MRREMHCGKICEMHICLWSACCISSEGYLKIILNGCDVGGQLRSYKGTAMWDAHVGVSSSERSSLRSIVSTYVMHRQAICPQHLNILEASVLAHKRQEREFVFFLVW
jgi:hypothetical protein